MPKAGTTITILLSDLDIVLAEGESIGFEDINDFDVSLIVNGGTPVASGTYQVTPVYNGATYQFDYTFTHNFQLPENLSVNDVVVLKYDSAGTESGLFTVMSNPIVITGDSAVTLVAQSRRATATTTISGSTSISLSAQSKTATSETTVANDISLSVSAQSARATAEGSSDSEIVLSMQAQSKPATTTSTVSLELVPQNLAYFESRAIETLDLVEHQPQLYLGQPFRVAVRTRVDLRTSQTKQVRYKKPSGAIGYVDCYELQSKSGVIIGTIHSGINDEAGEWEFRSWITFQFDPQPVPGEPRKIIIKPVDEV